MNAAKMNVDPEIGEEILAVRDYHGPASRSNNLRPRPIWPNRNVT